MPTPVDHLLALTLVILFPLRARSVMEGKLARASAAELPKVRLAAYAQAMIIQWTLTAVAVALWVFLGRRWLDLGVVPVASPGLLGVLFGLALVVLVVWRQSARGGPDDEAAEALRKQTAKLERMLPRSPRELKAFYGLSITAGICEEVLYRGYMIWYLQQLGLALIPAAAVSSLVFGFGHLYQGLRGVILTSVVGAFLSGVYLLSGSLLAGILIHALMDMHSGRLLYAAWSRPPAPPALELPPESATTRVPPPAREPLATPEPAPAGRPLPTPEPPPGIAT
jgi:membrane protease YdiL (CAAX protease family)